MNSKAFRSFSYGLYLVSTVDAQGRSAGCVVNTAAQVSSRPYRILVTINKDNTTCRAVQQTGKFALTVLSQDTTMELDRYVRVPQLRRPGQVRRLERCAGAYGRGALRCRLGGRDSGLHGLLRDRCGLPCCVCCRRKRGRGRQRGRYAADLRLLPPRAQGNDPSQGVGFHRRGDRGVGTGRGAAGQGRCTTSGATCAATCSRPRPRSCRRTSNARCAVPVPRCSKRSTSF